MLPGTENTITILPTAMSQKKRWTLNDIPDQTGCVAIVTGSNSGIGFETARGLAARHARVVMACRTVEKAEAARARILNDLTLLPRC